MEKGTRYEYCDIPECESDVGIGCWTKGKHGYTGTHTGNSVSGYTCQRWDTNEPHTIRPRLSPEVGDRNHNYCRNPG